MATEVSNNNRKRQLDGDAAAANNAVSKRRQLNIRVLQTAINDFSDEQLSSVINTLCGDDVVGYAVNHTRLLVEFWEEPFSKLPDELLLHILCSAFDTTRQALQLALVCRRWHGLFLQSKFWLPWIAETAGDVVGFYYLFQQAGLGAAVCSKVCRCDNLQTHRWCYERNLESVMMGYFHHVSFEGPAVVKYSNGDVYEGSLKSNQPHGQGTFYLSNGDRIEGQWKWGKQHGYGSYIWAIGGYIRGHWENDKLHGHSVKVHPSKGLLIVGNHKNGMLCGYAKKICRSYTYCGQWMNGQYHGYGTLHVHNECSYEGYFENGCFNGTGIYCWRHDDDRLEAVSMSTFKDDEFHGDCIEVRVEERIVVKGRRLNDTFVGLWRHYFENGDRLYKMYSDTGQLLWTHALCENGAVVYVYHPTASKNSALLSIDYSNGDRYVARVIDGIAVGRFIRQNINRTTISPFSSVKSSAAYYFKDVTFTSVM